MVTNAKRTLRRERVELRKSYHDQRRALWKNIGADYQTKKDAVRDAYKPKWKEHFGKKHDELRILDESTRNIAGRILMTAKYREQIGRQDMPLNKRVNAYVHHIVSQKKWLDGVEAKYEKQKQDLFKQYKEECKEMYKETRTKGQPAIQKAQEGYKEEAAALSVKQDAARQSVKALLSEQGPKEQKVQIPQKIRPSAIDRVAAMREKNKDRDGAERER